ncbi:phage tail-collar fiber domain-containing protein [Yersinia aldovae]|uniref:phage tail-collar fiber domain-containing protein n=1 Tax=Yersinia aldovae TaxID=29483 RepID=UPI0005AD2661|nr:phage tail protein [Yersinia aldovae]AJJ64756.1 phage tail fiber repeat family protein [Yersinia aldovae 670-83]
MSQTVITFAFEQWKAQQAAAGALVVLDEFVLAYVPDLDHTAPIDRAEVLPPAAQIVHRQTVNKIGLVNDNAVVYSVTMGTELGDFDFNWIGLVNKASGTVAMIVHAPTQRKVANVTGQQGNVLTRSFLMEYNGAATETGITTPAETWQIDFTARLTGIDEMQRVINVDNYGPGAFFDTAYLVAKAGTQFFVTKGTGYIGGIRADLSANHNISVPAAATKVWADVSLQGNITSQWEAVIKITVAPMLENYNQSGFMHYVFAVASIDAAGNITDLRPQGSLNEQETSDALAKHEKSRNHPDGTLTEKGFVQMSSATDSDSEARAATSKAAKIAMDNGNARLAKERNGADIPNAALFRQNLALKGAALVDIGKTAGTAAAGDDSRIVDAISIKNTNIQLPGILGSKGLQVFPLPGSPEGGEINLYDKDNKPAAYIDIDSSGQCRVVIEGVGVSLLISKTSGDVFIQKSLTATGVLKASGIVAEGTVYAGNTAAWLEANGNVYGPVWGGHLSTYLANRTDHRVRAWAAVQGNGTISSSFGFAAINRTNVGGYNFTMSTSHGAYAVTVGINGGSQGAAANAHSANIWNRTPNSFSIQNARDGGVSYDWTDWTEFYVIVVGP